jgi:hypothetical protein
MNKIIYLLMVFYLTPNWAWCDDGNQTESQRLRGFISRQFDRLNQGPDEAAQKIMTEIESRHGWMVSCTTGYLGGIWRASLPAPDCYTGLESVNMALNQIDSNLLGENKNSELKIEVSRVGVWQGITISDPIMKIPYNAHPDSMATFITRQVKMFMDLSRNELGQLNALREKAIHDQFGINVIRQESLSRIEYHDGLTKLQLALQMIFDKKPSQQQQQNQKLGVDAIVLASSTSRIYQDSGQLRIDIAATDFPGQMFYEIRRGVADKGYHFPFFEKYSQSDVEGIRRDQ